MNSSSRHVNIVGDGTRFLFAGAVNTIITLGVYEVAIFITRPSVAYTLSWIAGIILLVTVYPSRVFPGGRRGPMDRVALAATYCGVLVVGLILLRLFVAVSGAPRLAVVAVVVVTTSLNFVMARAILRR